MRVEGDRRLLTEFCVQLEYNTNSRVTNLPSNWMQVARFDHNTSPTRGHDIRIEGLHMDLYGRGGEKVDVLHDFPRIPLQQAPKWCRGFLEEHCQQFLRNFERRIKAPRKGRVYDR